MLRRSVVVDLTVLAALGAGVIGSSAWLGQALAGEGAFDEPARLAPRLAAPFLAWGLATLFVLRRRLPVRRALVVVVLVAIAARVLLAVQAPAVSNDVYRYVWDGRVQASGINPYRYPPDAQALAGLRDEEIWRPIDRKFAPTIYPPLAQEVFRGLYAVERDSVTWTKLAFSGVDVASILLLAALLARFRRPPEWALVYGWHPLPLLEIGQSGHVDGVAVFLALLALLAFAGRRPAANGIALAAAALVKPYAAVVLPAFLRRDGRHDTRLAVAFAASVVLAYLPFTGAGRGVLGYLPGYLSEEGFVSGERFYLLGRLETLAGGSSLGPIDLTLLYEAVAAAVLAAAALGFWRRPASEPREAAGRALLLLVLLLSLSSPAYPWYALLALAFVPLAQGPGVVAGALLATAAPLLYVQLKLSSAPEWPLHVVWGGTVAILAAGGLHAAWRRRAVLPGLRQRLAL